jgi:hypothetical protein
MTDRNKACLAFMLLFLALILPFLAAGAATLVAWPAIQPVCTSFVPCVMEILRHAAIPALAVFVILLIGSGVLLILIREPSWLLVWLPGALGLIYSLFPFTLPGPIDNGVAFAGGALLTFALWVKKQPDAPRWVIWPILFASLYTFVGGLIPFEVDELLVDLITAGGAYYYYKTHQGQIEPPRKAPPPSDENTIDGEFKVVDK